MHTLSVLFQEAVNLNRILPITTIFAVTAIDV